MLYMTTGKLKASPPYANDSDRWAALVARDRNADGRFFYSVRTTGVVRTNLPYRGLRRTASGYAVSPVVEYPIAVSDNDLDGGNVDASVAAWLQVVDKNLITGAPTMLLLHPTTGPGKVEALEAFLAGLATRDVWVGDLASYGEFYESQGF